MFCELAMSISTVADEVRLVRTKYSTSTVFNFFFYYYALSQEIFYYFKKIMFPEQENNIFDLL